MLSCDFEKSISKVYPVELHDRIHFYFRNKTPASACGCDLSRLSNGTACSGMLITGLIDFSVSPAFAPPNQSRDTQARLDVAFSVPVLYRCPNSLRQPYHRDWDKAQSLLVSDRGAFDTCDRHCTVVNRVSRTCSSNLPLLLTLCLERV